MNRRKTTGYIFYFMPLMEQKYLEHLFGTFKTSNSVLFLFGQILSCGLSGKWTTGWTGARLSLVSTAWVQTWEACTAVSCVAWTERPSWAWCLTAPPERFSGSIWRIWGEVHATSHPKFILPNLQLLLRMFKCSAQRDIFSTLYIQIKSKV